MEELAGVNIWAASPFLFEYQSGTHQEGVPLWYVVRQKQMENLSNLVEVANQRTPLIYTLYFVQVSHLVKGCLEEALADEEPLLLLPSLDFHQVSFI